MQAHDPETEDVVTVAVNLSKVHSLKVAIFHTMAFKLSLEINENKISQKSLIAFLKVLYNISKMKKKKSLRWTKICHSGNCIKYNFRPKLIFYFKRSILQSRNSRSNVRFQQHSSGLWLYANSRILQFVYPSDSPSTGKSTISIINTFTHLHHSSNTTSLHFFIFLR